MPGDDKNVKFEEADIATNSFDVNNKIKNMSVFFSDDILDDLGSYKIIKSPATSGQVS